MNPTDGPSLPHTSLYPSLPHTSLHPSLSHTFSLHPSLSHIFSLHPSLPHTSLFNDTIVTRVHSDSMHEVQNGRVCRTTRVGHAVVMRQLRLGHVTSSPHVVVLAVVGLVQLPSQSEGHREVKITLHPNGARQLNNSDTHHGASSHPHLVAGVLLNTERPSQLLSLLHSEAVLQVEHRLFPVRVARVWSCKGQGHMTVT